jgi:secondary thiamine-phosphate synthase enzyme
LLVVDGTEVSVESSGFSDIVNITDRVIGIVSGSSVLEGIVCVSVIGSTASVSTIEFEPALVQDYRDALERLASSSERSRHSETWGDDNGFSHIRATLMGPTVVLPVQAGRPVLGTWQQIVLIDHDNRPRSRRLFVQVMGSDREGDSGDS